MFLNLHKKNAGENIRKKNVAALNKSNEQGEFPRE